MTNQNEKKCATYCSTKICKCLNISLTKCHGLLDIYAENYELLIKEIREQNKWGTLHQKAQFS